MTRPLPLQQNRWVRYGLSGVGEEYIEDAYSSTQRAGHYV